MHYCTIACMYFTSGPTDSVKGPLDPSPVGGPVTVTVNKKVTFLNPFALGGQLHAS
jgi:hypothetical protein